MNKLATNRTSFKKGNKAHELTPRVKTVNDPALPEVATKHELMVVVTRRIRNGTFKGQVLLQACKLLADMQDQGTMKIGWQSCAPTVFQEPKASKIVTEPESRQEEGVDGWQ